MPFEIEVFENGSTFSSHPLAPGKQQLGSDAKRPIHIPHPEVAGLAATIDQAGDVIFLDNHNDFAIYVGNDELAPGSRCEWRTGNAVQLTRSISLALHVSGAATAADDQVVEKKNKSLNTAIQLAVILLCGYFSFNILTEEAGETEAATSVTRRIPKFNDLIAGFEQAGLSTLTREERTLMNYLTEARTLEQRWGKSRAEEIISAYELVLGSRLIHDQQPSEESLASQAKEFAASRIEYWKRFV
ncbi:MAG: hypothetical protein R3C05_20810 [Pirellulaceae bacterium]